MDPRFVLLAVLFVAVLLVFGGRNTSEERRRLALEDPIKKRIEQSLSNTRPGTAGGASPGYSPTVSRQGMEAGNSITSTVTPSSGGLKSIAIAPPRSDYNVPAFYLSDNRRIFFYGVLAFVLLPDGTLAPLPDGEYELQGGQKMTITGGRRLAQ